MLTCDHSAAVHNSIGRPILHINTYTRIHVHTPHTNTHTVTHAHTCIHTHTHVHTHTHTHTHTHVPLVSNDLVHLFQKNRAELAGIVAHLRRQMLQTAQHQVAGLQQKRKCLKSTLGDADIYICTCTYTQNTNKHTHAGVHQCTRTLTQHTHLQTHIHTHTHAHTHSTSSLMSQPHP